MSQLGGNALFLSSRDLQIGRGEPVEDTARVLSRYLDGIMIRTFAQQEVEDLAAYGSIPIINGLTDYAHPCQVLADLMTIREHKGSFEGLKLCFIGDGNNMANSLIVGGIKTGMAVSRRLPRRLSPDPDDAGLGAQDRRFQLSARRRWACRQGRGCGLSPTCGLPWARKARPRSAEQAFAGYQVNDEL